MTTEAMKKLITGTISGFALMLSTAGHAVMIAESGDAGDLTGSAQILPDGTDSVTGEITTNDADLYGFSWGGGLITIDTSTGTTFDTQLFLFDSAGLGLLTDDDSGGSLTSLLSTSLAAGDYFIGITAFNNDPVSSGGPIFSGPIGGPIGSGGGDPLSGWGTSGTTGTYTISFSAPTGASVPEPGIPLLLGIGGLAGFLARRYRRS